jgi:hypothetical protein
MLTEVIFKVKFSRALATLSPGKGRIQNVKGNALIECGWAAAWAHLPSPPHRRPERPGQSDKAERSAGDRYWGSSSWCGELWVSMREVVGSVNGRYCGERRLLTGSGDPRLEF